MKKDNKARNTSNEASQGNPSRRDDATQNKADQLNPSRSESDKSSDNLRGEQKGPQSKEKNEFEAENETSRTAPINAQGVESSDTRKEEETKKNKEELNPSKKEQERNKETMNQAKSDQPSKSETDQNQKGGNTPGAILLLLLSFLSSSYLFAQEKTVDVDINAGGGDGAWYGAWWVWVAGLALFVIIIVAIISAGKKA